MSEFEDATLKFEDATLKIARRIRADLGFPDTPPGSVFGEMTQCACLDAAICMRTTQNRVIVIDARLSYHTVGTELLITHAWVSA